MKILVIDSHKGTRRTPAQNLHWQNAATIANHLNADMIWSYKDVNDQIIYGYDAIVFVHASHYAYTDYEWLEKSPNAKLFHVSNEYNLGEPRTLWMAAKEGRHYTVIANHPAAPSKIVGKYVDDWKIVNLNALCVNEFQSSQGEGCIYYGSFRKGRSKYFERHLGNPSVTTSTHKKNQDKFQALGIAPSFVGRTNIGAGDLSRFRTSLYIEDEVTHTHYNHLANRFYESIQYGCTPLFDASCENTIESSSYHVDSRFTAKTHADVTRKTSQRNAIPAGWITQAVNEKTHCLDRIKRIVLGDQYNDNGSTKSFRALPPPTNAKLIQAELQLG